MQLYFLSLLEMFCSNKYFSEWLTRVIERESEENVLLNWRHPGPVRSVLLVVIGWLLGW